MYQNNGKSGHIKVKKKQEDYEAKRKEKKKFGHIIAAMDHYPRNRSNGEYDFVLNTLYHRK